MTILVTGGSGFLGSHVCEQLSRAGRPVRALVRKSSNVAFLRTLPGVELVDGAVDDRESFVRAAAGVTGIVHAAGLVKARSEDEFTRTNVQGTEHALDAAQAAGPGFERLVFVSSQAVQGPSDAEGNAVPTDGPYRPVTAYGRSKAAAERAVLAQKDSVRSVVIRPPAIYGPRDQEMLALFKTVKSRTLPYFGSALSKLSIIHGADAAAACVRALSADVPSGSVYFVDDGAPHTFADVAGAFERALGVRAWLRFPLPRPVVEVAAIGSELYGKATGRAVMLTRDKCNELFNQWVGDGAPARAALDWQPGITLDAGARQTAEWYRDHGWL